MNAVAVGTDEEDNVEPCHGVANPLAKNSDAKTAKKAKKAVKKAEKAKQKKTKAKSSFVGLSADDFLEVGAEIVTSTGGRGTVVSKSCGYHKLQLSDDTFAQCEDPRIQYVALFQIAPVEFSSVFIESVGVSSCRIQQLQLAEDAEAAEEEDEEEDGTGIGPKGRVLIWNNDLQVRGAAFPRACSTTVPKPALSFPCGAVEEGRRDGGPDGREPRPLPRGQPALRGVCARSRCVATSVPSLRSGLRDSSTSMKGRLSCSKTEPSFSVFGRGRCLPLVRD